MEKRHIVAGALVFGFLGGCGGTIGLGSLPEAALAAHVEIAGIEDGNPVPGTARPVSLGQSVPVTVLVANTGETAAAGVRVELILVRREGLVPVGDLARVVPAQGNPTRIAPDLPAARFSFEVTISPTAPPGAWIVSAHVFASQAQLPTTAPERLQRQWTLQRPPRLEVVSIEPEVGNVSFGYLSLNPGCPAVLVAQIRNSGDAAVVALQAKLVVGASEPPLVIAPVGTLPVRLVGGASARTAFRLDAPQGIRSGTDLGARVLLTGVDENSRGPVANGAQEGPALPIVASGARLQATRVTVPREPLAPGTLEVPFAVELLLLPGPGGAQRLDEVRVGLRFEREPEQWRFRPGASNPTVLEACTQEPPQTCPPTRFELTADVPPQMPPGPVPVSAGATAVERLGDGRRIAICGGSTPLFPESNATVTIR